MKKIWFIRHAESEGNAGKATLSNKANPLSEKGLKQANDLTSHLFFSDEPDLIVHSSYKRAIQTMKPYTDLFPNIPTEEWPVHEFTYLDTEKYKNTTQDERIKPRAQYWDRCDPTYIDGPGSESFNNLANRVLNTIDNLQDRDEKLIYVYSHGWFIKFVQWIILNESVREMHWDKNVMEKVYKFWESVSLPNTGIIKIAIQHNEIWMHNWVMKGLK